MRGRFFPANLIALVSAALLAACANAPRERVVVLPGPDGKVGTVVVRNQAGETTLNSAYAAVETAGTKSQARTLGEADIRQRYGGALDALPQRPRSFTLLFVFDKAQVVPESKGTIPAIVGEFSRRPAPEVLVIGHTDRAGDARYNEDLSRRRAEAARELLVKEGIPADRIELQWRGDRDPVPGAQATDPRNRRVEIKIR